MKRKIMITVTILAGILSVISATLDKLVDKKLLPPFVTPYLSYAWILFLAGAVATAFTEVLKVLQHENTNELESTQEQEGKQNRQRMLERVHATWIKGVLDQSLHMATLIVLGLSEQRDALANPWRLVFQQLNEQKRLPLGTPITQVYNDAGGELLILGEPGSGKTTLLLELTRDLLARAKQDDTLQIPIVFTLSSWVTEQQPLAKWLVEELNVKYQVPRRIGQAWVNADQILPLLDGLDEMPSNARAACVDTINAYRQEHMVPIVVCSRRIEYLAQTKRLALRNAVVVQPLTAKQIEEYLLSAGEQLEAVRVLLRNDPALRELAASPLMLSVLTLAYAGQSVETLQMARAPTTRQQVFANYVGWMLRRRGSETRYKPAQTIQWLAYLASQMTEQNQTIFYIEQLQPNWLSGTHMHQRYRWLAVRLPGALIGVLVSLAIHVMVLHSIPLPLYIEVILLGGGLGGFLSGGRATQQPPARNEGRARGIPWPRLLQQLGPGILPGLSVGLLVGFGIGSPARLFVGLLLGELGGLTGGLLSLLLIGGEY